ncbi:MAG: trehalose-phosphatase [Gaiellales bacterium]
MGADPLQRIRLVSGTSAILLDVDGTLAPIVAHPDLSVVPPETLDVIAALVERYALVGCVSGRRALDAARLVPVPGVHFAGNHGLELLVDGEAQLAGGVEEWLPDLRSAAVAIEPIVTEAGGWIEDKDASLTVHFREAPDPTAARALLELRAVPLLNAVGLVSRWGRMSLEARPPLPVDKGSAIEELLQARPDVRRSLYAGDDRTDLAGFAVVDVKVAVRSDETPDELLDAADVVVEGTPGLVDLLASLLD